MSFKNKIFILLIAISCQGFQQTNTSKIIEADSLALNGEVLKSNKIFYSLLEEEIKDDDHNLILKFKILENYLLVNELDSIKKYLIELKSEINNKNNNEDFLTRLYHNEGRMLFQVNKNIEALKMFIWSKNNATKLNQEYYIVLNNLFIGRLLYVSRDYENAEKYIQSAIKEAEKLGNKKIIIEGIGLLADYYINIGKYKKAKKKIQIIDSLRSTSLEEFAFHGLSVKYYLYIGNTEKMVFHTGEAMKLKVGLAIFKNLENTYQIDPPKGEDHLKDLNNLLESAKNLENDFLKDNLSKPYIVEEYSKIQSKSYLLTEKSYLDEIRNLKLTIHLKDSLHSIEMEKVFSDIERKHRAGEKEKENLKLVQENILQELDIEKEKKQKWIFGIGFLALVLIFLTFLYFYNRSKRQKIIIIKLQRELHHNIKNNLAIVDAFIEDTKGVIRNTNAEQRLNELQNRIGSIGEVHRQLYITDNTLNLNTSVYVNKLVENVCKIFPNKEIAVKVLIKESINLEIENIFPVGLIINEFLTNSYKHAFDNDKGAEIKVEISDNEKNYIINLTDNGKGLPQELDLNHLNSFGLEVMEILAEQLKGSFSIKSEKGVNVVIKFPKKT